MADFKDIPFLMEDTRPPAEVLPIPKGVSIPVSVQATAFQERKTLVPTKCDVCGKEEVHIQCKSGISTVWTFAYCTECANKGAEPYGVLVAYNGSQFSHNVQEWDKPTTQLHYHHSHLVQTSCEVAKKSISDFISDVRKWIISEEAEMIEYGHKDEVYHTVQDNPEQVFTFAELAGVFQKCIDPRYNEMVAVKYDNTMVLLVDYKGNSHLFQRRGDNKFTYFNRVEFVPEGDLRLNK
ncbi:hypothetical protein HPT25_01690 [Bacillus sp. BRMEA1]|uniref:hypothetical protein n=1 Tax=Neobacillus endophyticus TaxID=2738405 RepID=UPI0015662DB5|nr:hypothetical protein [Neobacillus endophyticus]NRD76220.1 hypothetical protein [Neobacillus endophyticus]